MSVSLTLLHLSLISGVGPGTVKKLLDVILGGSYDLYRASVSDLVALGIPYPAAEKVVFGLKDEKLFSKEYELLERTEISWTTLADPDYPSLLYHTYAPPVILYYQGTPVWNEGQTLAVVGSRDATLYGKRAVESLVAPCAAQGLIIVSGGARGIDTMAHEITMQQGGRTVAILGSGLLKPYPASNKKLFERIPDHGAVVSCFPLMTEAIGWQFPVRNRIIAGMARGCLIVQAAQESGALITARLALDEGRNVYAVPGHFDDPLSAGCNLLIKDGAQLVTSVHDILFDYGATAPLCERPAIKLADRSSGLKSVDASKKKQSTIPFSTKIPEEIKTVADLCQRPLSLEELVLLTQKSENELKDELFELQLLGKVQQDFAGLWVRL